MRDQAAISAKRKETISRRSAMKLSQYECKVQANKLSKAQRQAIDQLFRECKWWYNTIVTSENAFTFDTKRTDVTIKLKDGTEVTREISVPAQIRQDLLKRVQTSIKTLSTLKKKGVKVGRLKPVRFVDSVPLRELGRTYRLVGTDKLRVAGLPGKLRLNGLKRVPRDAEWANAKLVRKATGLYVVFTVYENRLPKQPKAVLGVDLGVKTGLTFSNGIEVDTSIPINLKIRKACQKVSRTEKGSKARKSASRELRKEHQRRKNIVKEVRNQILNVTRDYVIAVQDDNIRGWQVLWGTKVQSNGVGAIKQGWKQNPSSITVDRFVRTTRVCRVCGSLLNLGLSDRIINCECGHTEPRDLSAARSIGIIAVQSLPVERRSMPLETKPSTEMLKRLQSLPHISARLVDDRKERGVSPVGSLSL